MPNITKVEDDLVFKVQQRFSKRVQNYINKIQLHLNNLQAEFFFVFVQKVIGATRAPSLGTFTPYWEPLGEAYVDRRYERFGVEDNQFFLASDKLRTALESMDARTTFGTPTVVFDDGAFFRAAGEIYKPAGKYETEPRAKIVIDLFPKVEGKLSDIDVNKFFTKRFKNGNRMLPISVKLLGGYGPTSRRPIVPNFMQWWVNNRARQIIKKVGKL